MTGKIDCSYFFLFGLLVDSGVVVGTSLSNYLLEKSRVVFQVSLPCLKNIFDRKCNMSEALVLKIQNTRKDLNA